MSINTFGNEQFSTLMSLKNSKNTTLKLLGLKTIFELHISFENAQIEALGYKCFQNNSILVFPNFQSPKQSFLKPIKLN